MSESPLHVGVVGSGEAAEPFERLARTAGNRVTVRSLDAAAGLVAETDLLLLALPPEQVRSGVLRIAPGPDARIVLTTRGLEPGTGRRLTELVVAESACLRVGALAGPVVPAEVRRESPCAAVVASRFHEVTRLATRALHSPACRVYASEDLPGVELAGAMVEVLSMALGVARGLGLGVGVQALIVSRGVAEGSRLTGHGGGDARTFAGLAGVGELVAAAALPDHPGNVRGLALARGEADAAAAALCAALLGRERDLPITAAVGALAAGRARARDVLAGLMTRELREEFE